MRIEINTREQTREELLHLGQMLLSLAYAREPTPVQQTPSAYVPPVQPTPMYAPPVQATPPAYPSQSSPVPPSSTQGSIFDMFTPAQPPVQETAQPSIFDVFKAPEKKEHTPTFDVNAIVNNVNDVQQAHEVKTQEFLSLFDDKKKDFLQDYELKTY